MCPGLFSYGCFSLVIINAKELLRERMLRASVSSEWPIFRCRRIDITRKKATKNKRPSHPFSHSWFIYSNLPSTGYTGIVENTVNNNKKKFAIQWTFGIEIVVFRETETKLHRTQTADNFQYYLRNFLRIKRNKTSPPFLVHRFGQRNLLSFAVFAHIETEKVLQVRGQQELLFITCTVAAIPSSKCNNFGTHKRTFASYTWPSKWM